MPMPNSCKFFCNRGSWHWPRPLGRIWLEARPLLRIMTLFLLNNDNKDDRPVRRQCFFFQDLLLPMLVPSASTGKPDSNLREWVRMAGLSTTVKSINEIQCLITSLQRARRQRRLKGDDHSCRDRGWTRLVEQSLPANQDMMTKKAFRRTLEPRQLQQQY